MHTLAGRVFWHFALSVRSADYSQCVPIILVCAKQNQYISSKYLLFLHFFIIGKLLSKVEIKIRITQSIFLVGDKYDFKYLWVRPIDTNYEETLIHGTKKTVMMSLSV